jgi:hypothetical protein
MAELLCLLLLMVSATSHAQPIPGDPELRNLRFVTTTKESKRHVYLRGYGISGNYWIDEYRFLSSMYASPDFSSHGTNTPKVVIVDIRSGEVKETGYVGQVRCFKDGWIATHNVGIKDDTRAFYFGRLGESLTRYPGDSPPSMQLNTKSCQLVPRWKLPEDLPRERFIARYPLKVEHGAIMVLKPKDFPELRLGADEKGRTTFIRTGPADVPPLEVYWQKPSGERIDIPVNPGERINGAIYLPIEDAYQLSIDLTNTEPIKVWAPRFVRLLYPDGTIKRFEVPPPIMDLVRSGLGQGDGAYFSRLGMVWSFGFNSRERDPERIAGAYLIRGSELVKIQTGQVAPDGCRMFRVGDLTANSTRERPLREYYYFNACTGE